jgi:hypothetical protein
MTAEAIVMNRSAVALAADSAVTVSGPRAFKTFDTANKLFELIKGSNIGVMVYNNMILNGTPWETIIKAYRKDNANFSAPCVADYLEHFTKYLADSTDLLKPSDDEYGAIAIAFDSLVSVAEALQDRYDEYVSQKGNVIKTKLGLVLTQLCDEWEAELGAAADSTAASHLTSRALKTAFGAPLKGLVEDIFEGFELRSPLINRLTALALLSLTKQGPSDSESGLVFAGFGTKEYFPSFASTGLSARLLGNVISRAPEIVEVTAGDSGYIRTFAQDEPALGWITGISAQTRHLIALHWINWVRNELPRQLGHALPVSAGLTTNLKRKITSEVLKLAKERLSDFFKFMDQYERDEFIQPMFESVAALPKDELGLLAESLVNITSLKQRMSVHQSNTVGGAIDVAIISIGDGFVWINRKHYFDEKYNPTWHLTHGAKIQV